MTAQLLIGFASGQEVIILQANTQLPAGWMTWVLGTLTVMAIVRAVQLVLSEKEYINSKEKGRTRVGLGMRGDGNNGQRKAQDREHWQCEQQTLYASPNKTGIVPPKKHAAHAGNSQAFLNPRYDRQK